jgi:hypothetical protein
MPILLLVNWYRSIGSFEVSLNYCFEKLFDAEDDSSENEPRLVCQIKDEKPYKYDLQTGTFNPV